MSTILKTLRKLEEEKSLINEKLNLEEMLLKEDSSYTKLGSSQWKFFLLIGIVAIFLTAMGVIFYPPAPNYEVSIFKSHSPKEKAIQQTIESPDSPKFQTFEGIPMAAISSNELASNPKKKLRSKPFNKLLPDETCPVATSPDIVQVENLIRTTANVTKKNSTIEPLSQNGYIPGLKIKGIIFFENGSSSNHIIATTESSSNLKLRVGETFQDTVVKSIHPNYVIFLHRNQLIEVPIGR
jgi:hypothetical protein